MCAFSVNPTTLSQSVPTTLSGGRSRLGTAKDSRGRDIHFWYDPVTHQVAHDISSGATAPTYVFSPTYEAIRSNLHGKQLTHIGGFRHPVYGYVNGGWLDQNSGVVYIVTGEG